MIGAILAATILISGTAGTPSPAAAVHVRPWIDVGIVATIGALDLGAWELDRRNKSDPCPCDASTLPGFDRIAVGRHDFGAAQASNYLQDGSIVAAPLLVFLTDPGPLRDRAESTLIAIEAMSLAGSTTQFLKSAVHRPRPPSYENGATPPFDYHSFPSGHTTAAFSAAAALTTIYALRHPHSHATWWIAGAGFLVAGATGWFRVEAGRHFPSDVVSAAAMSTAVGVLVPLAHAETPVQIGIGPDEVTLRLRFGSRR